MPFLPVVGGEFTNGIQKRVLLSMAETPPVQEDNDGSFAATNYYDNTSNPGYNSFCLQPSDYYCDSSTDGILMIMLRWTRLFILKIGKMYYAAPLFLMGLPLVVGLLIGYGIGCYKRTSKRTSRRVNQLMANREKGVNEDESDNNSRISTLINFALRFVSGNWTLYRLFPRTRSFPLSVLPSKEREDQYRHELFSQDVLNPHQNNKKEKDENAPNHVAVIMDGNRRYGREVYPENPIQGHVDGSQTLLKFIQWCLEVESIKILTVYAFSTENWGRPASEVAALMTILQQYSEELRIEALKRRICIHVQSTDKTRIPADVQASLDRMVEETAKFKSGDDSLNTPSLTLNICLSYGGRDELVNVCRRISSHVECGMMTVDEIDVKTVEDALLVPDEPDLIIRTSGEIRLSNFLLWQSAYSELFFLPMHWPALKREDFENVLSNYAQQRKRRFGA